MRNYERTAVACLLGAIVAYLAGLLVIRFGGGTFAGLTTTFVITAAAIYAGWTWAQKDWSR